ncbi:hypothetical protein NUW58_g8055 [Xylaria curta]|uniref:Uncharacterized protein n=1 Tax=Xylaria curta TaxID=42375 RepID=A0ACC1NDR0_9PEZI|nr:hypothetical protein NUW58_g8055 [Xylaria curta]
MILPRKQIVSNLALLTHFRRQMGYKYHLLPNDQGTRYIRLVSLLSGSGNLRLKFQPEATCLGHDVVEPFEALSYVWGSGDDALEVEILGDDETNRPDDEQQQRQTISITQNLAVALQHIRYRDEPRVLWIDAICINQDNLSEKSHQVAFMGEVYKHARQVIIWLGPEADNSDRALEVLDEIGSQVTVDWANFTMSPTPRARDATLGQKLEPFPSYFTEHDADAVEALWARAWFERVWVRQEIALARSAIFQAGHKSLDRVTMRDAMYCFYHKDIAKLTVHTTEKGAINTGEGSESPVRAPPPLSRLSGGERCWLVNAMCHPLLRFFPVWLHYYAEGLQRGNPRNRVYGLLSLLRGLDDDTSEFVPNYLAPIVDCYQDLTLRHIEAERSLNILASCSISYKTIESVQDSPKPIDPLPGLPSWVPDWSVDLDRHLSGAPISGARPFLSSTRYLGDGVLRVAGVTCGTVCAASMIETSSTISMFRSLRKACLEHLGVPPSNTAEGQKTYIFTGESWATALSRLLVMDRFCENFEPKDPDFISGQRMIRPINRLLAIDVEDFSLSDLSLDGHNSPLDGPDFEIMFVERSFHSKLAGRRIFTTAEGHVGFGPASMRPGDIICLLLGCEFVIALRPKYSILTASDMIDREGGASSRDGPSPHSREQFLVLGDCFVPGLMAGEPLLGPLPPHLRLITRNVEGESDYQVCFLDTQTGEATLHDPRIQALESRLPCVRQDSGTETGFCDKTM